MLLLDTDLEDNLRIFARGLNCNALPAVLSWHISLCSYSGDLFPDS